MENGTYLVGTDIEPGRYRSPGVDGSLCYYDQTNADLKVIVCNNPTCTP